MTEQEWLTSDDPSVMLELLIGERSAEFPNSPWKMSRKHASERQLRLFACACNDALGCEEMDESELVGNAYQIAMNYARWTPSGYPPLPDNINEIKAFLLRDICGNPFRFQCLCGQNDVPVAPAPCYGCNAILSWNNGLVPKLAQQMYTSRNFRDMDKLADALEEAGCDNLDIIWHLRGWDRCPCLGQDDACSLCIRNGVATGMRQTNTSHVRGCWVIDLLLNRE